MTEKPELKNNSTSTVLCLHNMQLNSCVLILLEVNRLNLSHGFLLLKNKKKLNVLMQILRPLLQPKLWDILLSG